MYLDTAIIIKLLVKEPESDFYQEALSGVLLSSSELAWTEVRSALQAKVRAGGISSEMLSRAWDLFTKRVEKSEIVLHPLDTMTLRRASRILETYGQQVPLRTLDAIHTAACDLSQDFPLCTTDKRMRDAASLLHIPIFPE